MEFEDILDELRSEHFRLEEEINSLQNQLITCRGYPVDELIVFADACRRMGVDEADLKFFAQNVKEAYRYVRHEWTRAMENTMRLVYNE